MDKENEIVIPIYKIVIFLPLYLFLYWSINFVLFFMGIMNNCHILFKGKSDIRLSYRLLFLIEYGVILQEIIFFKNFYTLTNLSEIVKSKIEIESNEETISKKIILLERLGGVILFFQTRIIYSIFLAINWLLALVLKLIKKSNESIEKFISNSIEELSYTNQYLAGLTDERIRWNSLDDPIAGIFYPLLTHGFLFGYFLLYSYLAILKLEANPIYIIASPGFLTIGQIIHSISIIIVIYYLVFLILIPYYIRYPEEISKKKKLQSWQEIGFTIKYPLRDLLIVLFYSLIFIILYYGTIVELIETRTIDFDSFRIIDWLVMGIFWGIAEEIAFRGYVIMGLERKVNTILTITICSGLFGLYHILQAFAYSLAGIALSMLNAFIIGLFLAIFRIKSKSFIGPTIIHIFDYIFFKNTFNLYHRLLSITDLSYYRIIITIFTILPSVLIIYLIYPKKKPQKIINEI